MRELKTILREELKAKPEEGSNLGFGKIFTDYMLTMDYTSENGWGNAIIEPYDNISISPAAMGLHYGQLIFEGLKAYYTKDGSINIFRPMENIKRLNRSATRLCMPTIDEEEYLKQLSQLINLEKDWIPKAEGASLYIRPFMFATESYIGVRPSNKYTMLTILSPVGSYYAGGMAPTKIYVEDKYVRAVPGGVGEAKCAGNYAASLRAQVEAEEKGYNQIIWLDGVERRYIEEVGTSNAFFVIGGEVVTPELNGSLLPGITRDSVMRLLKLWDIPVVERKITIDELVDAYNNNKLDEAFASGTAAIISPIGELSYKGNKMTINNNKVGNIAQKLYDGIVGIQKGEVEDSLNWIYKP